MEQIQVFIEDQIRGQHIRANLDVKRRIAGLVQQLVKDYGLPRRDLKGQPLTYRLERALDGHTLPADKNLDVLGVANREILRLVSPQGRQTWTAFQEILEQIQSEITDEATGKLKERVTEKVWRGVEQKLKQLEQANPNDPRLKLIRRWVDTVNVYGGPGSFMDLVDNILEPFNLKNLLVGAAKLLLAVALSLIVFYATGASDGKAPSESPVPPVTVVTVVAPTPEPNTPVAPVETVEAVTPASPTASPTPIPPSATPTEPPSPTPCVYPASWVKIVVKRGDTLRSLAHEYDSSVNGLTAANCLTSDQLMVGSELYVPLVPTRTPTPRPFIPPPASEVPHWPVRTKPPVEPVRTESPIQETEPPVQYTEPPVQVTEPPVQYTEPPVQVTEPPVQQTEPPINWQVRPELLQTLAPLQQYWLPTPTESWPVIR